MCMDYYNASEDYLWGLFAANVFFCIVFILECLFKLIGLGPVYYFSQSQNLFDFFLVLTGVMTLSDRLTQDLNINLTVFRIFRAARLLRMIKASKTI